MPIEHQGTGPSDIAVLNYKLNVNSFERAQLSLSKFSQLSAIVSLSLYLDPY